jgi:BlaI family penicillinase repressor
MSAATPFPASGVRHSILDLAPLELDCLSALWPRGEATVREIQQALAPTRPRAYTTIMTILDRLTQKGVVERRKTGRAWTYRPNVSEQDARSRAVTQLVNSFFDGSAEALTAHLAGQAAGRVGALPGAEAETGRVRKGPSLVKSVSKKAAVDAPEPEPEKPRSAELETTLL